MWWRSHTGHRSAPGSTAHLEAPPAPFQGSQEQLREEIARLAERNRRSPELEAEHRLLALRNLLGIARLEAPAPEAEFAEPEPDGLREDAGLPEVEPRRLTPGLLRAALLGYGCLLVRGLVERQTAVELAERIERSCRERDRYDAERSFDPRLYLPFEPDPRRGAALLRHWVKAGGGVLAADSPRLSFELSELYREAGLTELVEGYLGEPVLLAADKTTLRRAEPSVAGAWHQDGKFMGEVRALNLWLALSPCGVDAPGLDLVPRRLEAHVATQTEEAVMLNQVSEQTALAAAGDRPILRPRFEPGDALLFDELFLHKTASDPRMRRPRYAVESWFFGVSGFPADYVPLAL